jgi:hypothetical protein
VSASAHSLHLLSIELSSAPSSLRAVLELGQEDVAHWLSRAKAAGAPLLIVCGPDCVDLYSSEEGRRAAFKPLLESLWAVGRNLNGFDRVKAREAQGHAVVRHLLRQAAGLESTEHGVSYARAIAEARARAALHGTLSDALLELFFLASAISERSELETELSGPHSTPASREIEALSAERIVEEELLALRVAAEYEARRSYAPLPQSSRPPLRSTIHPLYGSSEPDSCVRLRIAPLSPAPIVTRRSG